jgi:pentatricopeptide repeat protein
LIVALCRANALPEALQALQEMSHVLSDNRPFHLLPGKKRRPSTVEASDPLPVSLAVGNKDSPLEVETDMPRDDGQISKVEEEEEEERDGDSGSQNNGHNIKKNVEGFHHWEVRKEMQDAYNALINAAGQAGKYKLAESLFSEMRSLGLRLSIYTFNALLRAVVEGRGIEHALRVVMVGHAGEEYGSSWYAT